MKKIVSVIAITIAFLLIVITANQTVAFNKAHISEKGNITVSVLPNSFVLMPDSSARKASTANAGKDKGIGPFKDKVVELGPINQKWVSEGKGIFTSKCVLCHELDQTKIGPPLRNITKDRAPEYILNMIVNPTKMQKEDANVKILIKKYNNILMTELGISSEQARSVLEYLRSVAR